MKIVKRLAMGSIFLAALLSASMNAGPQNLGIFGKITRAAQPENRRVEPGFAIYNNDKTAIWVEVLLNKKPQNILKIEPSKSKSIAIDRTEDIIIAVYRQKPVLRSGLRPYWVYTAKSKGKNKYFVWESLSSNLTGGSLFLQLRAENQMIFSKGKSGFNVRDNNISERDIGVDLMYMNTRVW